MKPLNFIPAGQTIAVVGGGGKTSFIDRLEADLFAAGRPALVTLTTRLGRGQLPRLERAAAATPAEAAEAARRAASGERLLLVGPERPDDLARHKFSGPPPGWFPALRQAAGPETTILVEADGSAGRPLKLHRAGEPVPPPPPVFVAAVLGLSALRLPWPEAVHRPEDLHNYLEPPPRYAPLTPGQVAAVIRSAWDRLRPDVIFLNQADALEGPERALAPELARLLAAPNRRVLWGSLKDDWFLENL